MQLIGQYLPRFSLNAMLCISKKFKRIFSDEDFLKKLQKIHFPNSDQILGYKNVRLLKKIEEEKRNPLAILQGINAYFEQKNR